MINNLVDNHQINQTLLKPNELDTDLLIKYASNLKQLGVDFGDIYLQHTTSESWKLDEGIIKSGSFAINCGVGVRGVFEQQTFLNYSNIISPKSIQSLISNLFIPGSDKSRQSKYDMHSKYCDNIVSDKNIAVRAGIPKNSLYSDLNPISSLTSQQKIELLNFIDINSRKLPMVTNVIAAISCEYDNVFIAKTDLDIAYDIRPLIHISITIVIKTPKGKIEKCSSGFGGRYLISEVCHETLSMHINKAHSYAILKAEAIAAPQGKLPVVLGNGWAGIILHEAIGHGLESDFNRKGSSAFANKIGTKVANEQITVIDSGIIKNKRGSLNIDDEGTPTQETVLIENGILKNYMFDQLNARLMQQKSTGNGRRESFASKPIPRMTNTYMLNGKYTHDELIESIKNGIYAESFEGGQVDITSGQFVFNANVAWVIKDGKLSHPIKGCALVGNGPECLNHVSMVANNAELDQGVGTCGKDGQSVPVGVGQPSIRINDGLVVGGG
jgi:TldD protein